MFVMFNLKHSNTAHSLYAIGHITKSWLVGGAENVFFLLLLQFIFRLPYLQLGVAVETHNGYST